MKFAPFQLSLKGRALRLLSGREHSRQELERRLASFETSGGELAGILDELEGKGFINAQRVVESVVHRRSATLGASRIKQELQSKGVDRDRITEAVAALQSTELERALALWHRKFGEVATEPSVRARQARFLASRGFGGDVIRKVLAGDPENA